MVSAASNFVRQMLTPYSDDVEVEYRENGGELHVFIYIGLTAEDILQGEESVQGIDRGRLKNILAEFEGVRKQIVVSLLGDFQKANFTPLSPALEGEDTYLVLGTTHVHFFEEKAAHGGAVKMYTAQD